jgi:hypothetical protein
LVAHKTNRGDFALSGFEGRFAAHGHTVLVADFNQIAPLVEIGRIVPTAEKAHANASSACGEGLAPLHRIEDGFAGIFLGPHRCQAAGIHSWTGAGGFTRTAEN